VPYEPSDREDAIESASIRRSLPCIGCGYQLRGLPVGGTCPECGVPVIRTVMAVIDPMASGLPSLRRPRVVANGLFGLVACIAAAGILLVPRPLAARLELVTGAPAGRWMHLAPTWLPYAAAACLLLALAFVAVIAPPPGEEEAGASVTRGIRRLRTGLLAWAGAAAGFGVLDVRPPFDPAGQGLFLLMAAGAAWTFYALRGTVRVIGERSRQYRTGRGGRQGFREMAAAAGGVALGQLATRAGEHFGFDLLTFVGLVLAWVSVVMLLVGLVYMVVNAAWIRHALMSPPPTLAELLGARGGEEIAAAGARVAVDDPDPPDDPAVDRDHPSSSSPR
jgi:hypothetical protein